MTRAAEGSSALIMQKKKKKVNENEEGLGSGHVRRGLRKHTPHLKPAVQERPVEPNRDAASAGPSEMVPVVRASLHCLRRQLQRGLRVFTFLVGQG